MKFPFKPLLVCLVLSALLSAPFRYAPSRLDAGRPVGLKDVVAAAQRAASAGGESAALAACVKAFHESARILAGMKPVVSKGDPVRGCPNGNLAFLLPDAFHLLPAERWSLLESGTISRPASISFRLIRPPLA